MGDKRHIKPTIPAQLILEMLQGARSKGIDIDYILQEVGKIYPHF